MVVYVFYFLFFLRKCEIQQFENVVLRLKQPTFNFETAFTHQQYMLYVLYVHKAIFFGEVFLGRCFAMCELKQRFLTLGLASFRSSSDECGRSQVCLCASHVVFESLVILTTRLVLAGLSIFYGSRNRSRKC